MEDLKQIFEDCPRGCWPYSNGGNLVYIPIKDKSQVANYTSWGYKKLPQPAEEPTEVKPARKTRTKTTK